MSIEKERVASEEVSSRGFVRMLKANVNNEHVSDADFREFIRNTLPVVADEGVIFDLKEEAGERPLYAIGVEYRPGEMGMTHGPTPNLEEMLAVIPHTLNWRLVRFFGKGEEEIIRTASQGGDHGELGWVEPEVDADGPQCHCVGFSHFAGCPHRSDDVPF